MKKACVAAGALMLALLPACGNKEDGRDQQPAAEVLQRAGDKTRAAKTAQFTIGMRIDPGGYEMRMTGRANTDRTGMSGDMTFVKMPDVPEGATAKFVNFKADSWIKLKGQDDWFKAPSDPTSGSVDIHTGFQYMGRTMDDVEEDGREDLSGVPTTRYRGRFNLKKYRDSLPPGDREQYGKEIDRVGLDSAPVTVWVDERGLVRRMRYDIKVQAQGQRAKVTADIDFERFGVPGPDKPPPPQDVRPLP